MPIPPNPGQVQRDRYFRAENDPPPPRTFELGLVLGGTVSAGTYTAGALDALIEALDGWYAAHDGKPPHDVKIPVLGGASGGGVCATLLALMSNKDVPHAKDKNGAGPENLYWDIWVNRFDIAELLDLTDVNGVAKAVSVLNAGMIEKAVADSVAYAAEPGTVERPWIAHPIRVALTQGNLRGIPYKITDVPPIGTYTGDAFVRHDDYGWFAVPNWQGVDDGNPARDKRPDEFWVAHNPQAGVSVPFETLGRWATATGAFPLGFPSRKLERPAEHYLYRPFVQPTDGGPPEIRWPVPDWDVLTDVVETGTYTFLSVDGGTYNNNPVGLVHAALAGVVGINPRLASEANRAMLLIDALADPPDTGLCPKVKDDDDELTKVAGSLITAFIAESRYRTADLDLFADPSVFSRFQLVPHRTDDAGTLVVGERAIAGGTLGAFGGFLTPEFRVHDYLLGRANIIAYLHTKLLLAGDNHVFDGWVDAGMRADYARDAQGNRIQITPATPPSEYFLPIIPTDIPVPVQPDWPFDTFKRTDVRDKVKERLEKIVDLIQEKDLPGFGGWLLSVLVVPGIAGTLADKLVGWAESDLVAWGLAPRPPADPDGPAPGLAGGGAD